MTPNDRTVRARIAALTMHSRNDTMKVSQPGRDVANARFLDQQPIDLPEEERQRRADLARRAWMTKLAYRSARARRKKRSP